MTSSYKRPITSIYVLTVIEILLVYFGVGSKFLVFKTTAHEVFIWSTNNMVSL